MKTHTHRGHCQICDRIQAVNVKTGRIAKHGYNVRWDFYSGTCPGSDHLPYEKSADLLPLIIASTRATIQRFAASIDDTKRFGESHPTEGKITVRHALPANLRTIENRWEHREIAGHFEVESVDQGYTRICFVAAGRVEFKDGFSQVVWSASDLYLLNTFYTTDNTPEAYAAKWCKDEIKSLARRIRPHDDFANFLTARLAAWKLADLIPV